MAKLYGKILGHCVRCDSVCFERLLVQDLSLYSLRNDDLGYMQLLQCPMNFY